MRTKWMAVGLSGLMLVAAMAVGPGHRAVAAGVSAAATSEAGLRLEVTSPSAELQAGTGVALDVTVTNTGTEQLSYWLPTPCDPVFTLSVTAPGGGPGIVLKPEQWGMACIQVIKLINLAPGESLSGSLNWAAGSRAPAGTYTLTVQFEGRSDGKGEAVQVNLPLSVTGSAQSEAGTDLADTAGHWAGAQVRTAVRAGFVHGYPDGDFKPDGMVTRAEFMKMLVLALGHSPEKGRPSGMVGLEGHWAEQQGYLSAAAEVSLVLPGDFEAGLEPDRPATRGEVIRMLVRAMGASEAALELAAQAQAFADADAAGPELVSYVAYLHGRGLLHGYGDGTVRAGNPVTRAEAVTLILRILDALEIEASGSVTQ